MTACTQDLTQHAMNEGPGAYLKSLQEILEHRRLTPLFQPIISLHTQRIYGYEALIRGPSNSPLHAPLKLFDAAGRAGLLAELDMLCREVILEGFRRLDLPGKLFVNVSPECLLQPGFRPGKTQELLRAHNLTPERVVIELTEHNPTNNYTVLRDAAEHYRQMGFEIAIDDLGAGYSGLRLWSELRPEYVKIDMHFVQGLHEDHVKQQFVKSIQEISGSLNCRIIAEGVECREEFLAIREMGIPLAQGYYFAKPRPQPPVLLPRELFLTRQEGPGSPYLKSSSRYGTAASLIRARITVTPDATFQQVGEMFCNAPELTSIPVVQDAVPIGLVKRHQFMNMFASHFGRDLHGKKPISRFMDSNPVVVDKNMPFENLSKLLVGSTQVSAADEFLITARGRYVGVGTIAQLLQKLTELQLRNARYSNPLTLLPGSVPINECVDGLLHKRRPFTLCYFDLDNFKPFNDVYGYSAGDEAIKLLAEIITEVCGKRGDFVGHIGGDDFVVVFLSESWRERCQTILNILADKIVQLYQGPHIELGGISTKDRRGQPCFYPIMTLSIAAVEALPGRFLTHHDISMRLSQVKQQAKSVPGNVLFVDRRESEADGQLNLIGNSD